MCKRDRERKAVNFTSRRKIFFGISIAAILAGFVFMGIGKAQTGNTLNYSLEFVGGTSTNVTFNEDMALKDIDSQVVPLIEKITGDGNVQTQKIEGTNEVIFKTRSLDVSERETFKSTMVEKFGVDAEKITTETNSSTVSGEMKSGYLGSGDRNAVYADLYLGPF